MVEAAHDRIIVIMTAMATAQRHSPLPDLRLRFTHLLHTITQVLAQNIFAKILELLLYYVLNLGYLLTVADNCPTPFGGLYGVKLAPIIFTLF